MPDDTLGDLYLTYRDLIEWAIAFVCRRHGLHGDEAQDFAGDVRLHFLDPKAAVLRRFAGRSQPKTYICTVVNRQAIDGHIKRRGRWRPSKVAERAGPAAIRLEELLIRQGHPLDQGLDQVISDFPTEDRERLTALADQFPPHSRREFVDSVILDDLPAGHPDPEHLIL